MVSKKKEEKLTKKQRQFIEDLFAGADEQQTLEKYEVSAATYNRWLDDGVFTGSFNRRLENSHRQVELIIARYASLAAARLVELTESENQETRRKACLDIISLPAKKQALETARIAKGADENGDNQSLENIKLSPETAGRLLEAMARENEIKPASKK